MEAETTTATQPCQNQASKNINSLLAWKGTDEVTLGLGPWRVRIV